MALIEFSTFPLEFFLEVHLYFYLDDWFTLCLKNEKCLCWERLSSILEPRLYCARYFLLCEYVQWVWSSRSRHRSINSRHRDHTHTTDYSRMPSLRTPLAVCKVHISAYLCTIGVPGSRASAPVMSTRTTQSTATPLYPLMHASCDFLRKWAWRIEARARARIVEFFSAARAERIRRKWDHTFPRPFVRSISAKALDQIHGISQIFQKKEKRVE